MFVNYEKIDNQILWKISRQGKILFQVLVHICEFYVCVRYVRWKDGC